MSIIKLYFIQPPEGAPKSMVSEKEIRLKCQLYKFYVRQLKPQCIPFHAMAPMRVFIQKMSGFSPAPYAVSFWLTVFI